MSSGVWPHSKDDFWDEYDLYIIKDTASSRDVNQLINWLLNNSIGSKPMTYSKTTGAGKEVGVVFMINKKHHSKILEASSKYGIGFIWNRVIKNSMFHVHRPSSLGGGKHTRALNYTENNLTTHIGWIHQCSLYKAHIAPFVFHDYMHDTFWCVEYDRVPKHMRKPVKALGKVKAPSKGPRYKDYANAS